MTRPRKCAGTGKSVVDARREGGWYVGKCEVCRKEVRAVLVAEMGGFLGFFRAVPHAASLQGRS